MDDELRPNLSKPIICFVLNTLMGEIAKPSELMKLKVIDHDMGEK